MKKRWPVFIPIVLFLASLPMKVVSEMDGIAALLMGFFALFFQPEWGIVWLANIFWGIGIVLNLSSKERKLRAIPGLIGLILVCGSFMNDEIMVNEGGGMDPAILQPGFFVWMSSFVTLLVISFIPRKESPQLA